MREQRIDERPVDAPVTPSFEQVEEAAGTIRRLVTVIPQIAIVLGSGLGTFADTLTGAVSTPYGSITHWPVSNVIGHAGRLVIGTLRGRGVAALAGRSHAYEGHSWPR